MTNEPSTRRRWPHLRHPGRWLLVLTLAACAWLGWRVYDERAAIREAQAVGWKWESRDPVSLILADWRAAGRKETWTERYRQVNLPDGTDLASARPLLVRLHPTGLVAHECPDPNLDALRGLPVLEELALDSSTGLQNVDALRGLPALQGLSLYECTGLQNVDGLRCLPALSWLDLQGCTGLQNVDALRGLSALKTLYLDGCTGLQNVDALRGLPALREIRLNGCTGLQNVDGLRGLPALHEINLSGCTGLQNADGLRGLPTLRWLDLSGCTALPASALRELRLALPETHTIFPDGRIIPP